MQSLRTLRPAIQRLAPTTPRRYASSVSKAKTPKDIIDRLYASNPILHSSLLRSMSEPAAKKVKMPNGSAAPASVIGTHNGHFHADEALAVHLLRLLPEYQNATITRSRDPEVLNKCNIVVDVGGVHDDSAFRYDHHQREFNATFPGKNTKLSSAGLVWMHYGKRIISHLTSAGIDNPDVELLYQKLYEDFIEAFDANDNGISAYDPQELRKAGIEKKFSDKSFTIASVVGRYNHMPITPGITSKLSALMTTSKAHDQTEEDARFIRASSFVGEQFELEISDKVTSWLPARGIVKKAFEARHSVDPSGRIIVIPWSKEGVPWSDHLYALEEETGSQGNVLYALFAENGEADSKWRIRSVSLEPGSFENRKGLPEAWRGVRDDELSKVSGIPGCIFVHASGFIGGNQTYEGALEMAKKAVEF